MRLRGFEIHCTQMICIYVVEAVLKLLKEAYPDSELVERGQGLSARWVGVNANSPGALRVRPANWPKEAGIFCATDNWFSEEIEEVTLLIPRLGIDLLFLCSVRGTEVDLYRYRREDEPKSADKSSYIRLTADDFKVRSVSSV